MGLLHLGAEIRTVSECTGNRMKPGSSTSHKDFGRGSSTSTGRFSSVRHDSAHYRRQADLGDLSRLRRPDPTSGGPTIRSGGFLVTCLAARLRIISSWI